MDTDMHIFMRFMHNTLMHLPGVIQKPLFEDEAFYVNGKIFANVKEKQEVLAVHTLEREKWMAMDPDTYFITPHYLKYKYMSVRLETASPDDVKQLLITAYLARATKKLSKEYEEMKVNGSL